MISGWYYLHENGDLIYRRELYGAASDIRESDFALGLWPLNPNDRRDAWDILVESLAAGANPDRVQSLAKLWGCNDADAAVYADEAAVDLKMDGNAWCATRRDFVNLQESPAGFGISCLEAMANLAKDLGYRPSTMWGKKFRDLTK